MNSKYKPRYFKIPGFNDGGLDCSCPGFGWQGKCKHVKGIASRLISEAYPKYAHFSD